MTEGKQDDTGNHHILYPNCKMHFSVETPYTKSGYWFPLADMEVGDYIELLEEGELEACRNATKGWNRDGDRKYAVRPDRAQEGVYVCRRIE